MYKNPETTTIEMVNARAIMAGSDIGGNPEPNPEEELAPIRYSPK